MGTETTARPAARPAPSPSIGRPKQDDPVNAAGMKRWNLVLVAILGLIESYRALLALLDDARRLPATQPDSQLLEEDRLGSGIVTLRGVGVVGTHNDVWQVPKR